jgi:hypothetical protein
VALFVRKSHGSVLQITFIQAAGPGFKKTPITAGPMMSNKMKGET